MGPKRLTWIVLPACAGFAIWYFLIDTLSFSELAASDESPGATIMFNLLDFDTDLTRTDVFRLKSKYRTWERRIRDIEEIREPALRSRREKELLAEITSDPSIKKILHKVRGFYGNSALFLVKAIAAF